MPRLITCPDHDVLMKQHTTAKGRIYWACPHWPQECEYVHGAHQEGPLRGQPLGTPANAETRALRVKVHAAFDRLWKSPPDGLRLMSRGVAYRNLRAWLKIKRKDAHISMLNKEQLNKVLEVLERFGVRP